MMNHVVRGLKFLCCWEMPHQSVTAFQTTLDRTQVDLTVSVILCWTVGYKRYIIMYLVSRVFPLRKWKKPWERGCKALVSTRTVLERLCPSESQNRSRIEAELQPWRYLIFLRWLSLRLRRLRFRSGPEVSKMAFTEPRSQTLELSIELIGPFSFNSPTLTTWCRQRSCSCISIWPIPHVFRYFWKWRFFLRFLKYASTRTVFESFRSVYAKTLKWWNYDSFLYRALSCKIYDMVVFKNLRFLPSTKTHVIGYRVLFLKARLALIQD